MKRILATLAVFCALLAAVPAQAGTIVNFSFSGANAASQGYDNNSAVVSGWMDIDLTQVSLTSYNSIDFATTPGVVTGLYVTVTGSGAGDGTFTMADFSGIVLDLSELYNSGMLATLLASHTNLVGQPTTAGNGYAWGTPDIVDPSPAVGPVRSFNGDFQLVAKSASAPTGVYPYVLGTNGGNDQAVLLTNFQAVPEPGTCVLMALGIGGVFVARRRRG